MTWLITGGSGQLAKTLIDVLKAKGAFYTAVSKEDLDITSPDSVEKTLQLSPSVIVNCAAYTMVDKAESEPELATSVNGEGAKNVALAAEALRIPLIHVSTDYVFSGDRVSPWKTTDKTEPVSQYGKSKLLGENYIRNLYPENSLILRTAWLYGPFGKNFAKSIIKKAISTNEEIKVVDDQFGQPTSTLDLAKQIYEAKQNKIPSGTYHATNSGKASWFEFARELVALSGESLARVKPIQTSDYPTPAKRPSYSVLDHSEWQNTVVPEMDDWKNALKRSFSLIMQEVEKELNLG